MSYLVLLPTATKEQIRQAKIRSRRNEIKDSRYASRILKNAFFGLVEKVILGIDCSKHKFTKSIFVTIREGE